MKKILVSPLLVFFSVQFVCAQQEYTLTTTAANITSAKALIDLPGLSGNTNAIIVATPLGNTKTLNPNPTGAWYYSGKWNIFNSNYAVMIPGLTYKVKYFLIAGVNQFLHLVTQQNLGSEGSYIDNPALNNKPNAQFEIFQNHAPDVRPGSWLNQFEAKSGYSASAGKWYITNVAGQPLLKGCAYNIVVSAGGTSGPDITNPIDNPSSGPCKCPASLPPEGQAKGDLAGMYPDPMVVKILGRPLSNTAPVIGQVLKWNGTEWAPANVSGTNGNSSSYTPGLGITITGSEISAAATTPMWNAFQILGRDIMITPPTVGQVLKWQGASWAPADDVTSSAMQTFYKLDNSNLNIGQTELSDTKPTRIISALSHSIVLTKNSRLVISAGVSAIGPFCPAGCTDGYGSVNLRINNTDHMGAWISLIAGWVAESGNISNYMVDLNPGTYNIEFIARHYAGKSNISISGNYSSIMVIPLQ